MPCGAGKTFTAALLVRQYNKPALWLAHRKELIAQAAAALRRLGLTVQIIAPGFPTYSDFFGFTGGPVV